jgi:hypothetical protein
LSFRPSCLVASTRKMFFWILPVTAGGEGGGEGVCVRVRVRAEGVSRGVHVCSGGVCRRGGVYRV